MNRARSRLQYCFTLLSFSILCCFFCYIDAGASEVTASTFRSGYDITMKWVNFFIILILFFKYGYKPFKTFIQLQKNDVEKQLETLETMKATKTFELEQAIKLGEKQENRIFKLRDRMISEGEKKYHSIIEQAQNQSSIMFAEANRKAKSSLLEARKLIRNEIIDLSIRLAEEKLELFVNDDYDKTLLDHYMRTICQR